MNHDESLPMEERLLFGLEQVVQALGIFYERHSRENAVSPLQLRILTTLLKRGVKQTVGGMAEEFSLTAATVSDAIASLEEKGLLTKDRQEGDRRVVHLSLSGEGKRLVRSQAASNETLLKMIRGLSQVEQEIFLVAIIKLIRGFQEKGLIPVARMCANCRFFRPNVYSDPEKPHHCGFVNAAFGNRELRIECPDYEVASNPEIK